MLANINASYLTIGNATKARAISKSLQIVGRIFAFDNDTITPLQHTRSE